MIHLEGELMKARFLRQFHPVGQGAFYTEHIICNHEKLNVIYDCGSSTSKAIVEEQIIRTFKEGETIHALFISHLHEDHINGIPFLIKYCQVKNIFFPLISDVNKLSLLQELNEQNSSNDFTYQFISNPKNAINNLENNGRIKPKLIAVQEVSPNDSDSNNDIPFDLENDSPSQANSEGQLFDQSIPSGRIIKSSRFKGIWEYIPFNFDQNNRKQELETVLRKSDVIVCNGEFTQYGKTLTPTEAIQVTKGAYDKITGKRNSNSMTLFSGTSNNISLMYRPIYFRRYDIDSYNFFLDSYFNEHYNIDFYNFIYDNFIDNYSIYELNRYSINHILFGNMNPGCLYTGDYDAATDIYFSAIKDHYEEYWSTIGCFQVPHHGSKNNFNIGLIEKNNVYIISAGKHNKYRHPSATVLKKIHLNGGYPFVITEDFSSYLAQTFCFDF